MDNRSLTFATICVAWLVSWIGDPGRVAAATYEVGPGKPFTNISAVAWESLQAGDTVLIHWRTNAYKEKWVICRQGTSNAPITVRGMPGPNGELPVIDGENATTRSALSYWNENRSIIKIGGASVPADTTPKFIVIENLDIRGARPPFTYKGAGGVTASYIANASAIYVEKCENLIVRNCRLHDCGNGFFVASSDTLASRNILVEGNDIFDNGNVGSIYEHNNYTAAINITFQYNHFGPLRAGCSGNNLKDRSAGLIVRYNWIESGNRQLDLVEGEDSVLIRSDPGYHTTYVYGNVLVEPDGAGNRQIAHYGGDGSHQANYRQGALYFYNNTIYSTRTDRTTLLRLSTNNERCDCRNNIIYTTAAGNTVSILDDTGLLNLTHNWLKPGWVNSFANMSGTITNDGSNLTGAAPGFLDEARQIYFLTTNSPCRDTGVALHTNAPATHFALRHYIPRRLSVARPNYQTLDIGAYEFSQLEAWRYANFGTNASNPFISSDTADPNTNGIPNLVEYAFLQNPNGTTGPGMPKPMIFHLSSDHFGVQFARRLPPTEVTYRVQTSPDLQLWNDGSFLSDSGDLLTNAFTTVIGPAGTNLISIRLNQTLDSAPRQFMRVRVER